MGDQPAAETDLGIEGLVDVREMGHGVFGTVYGARQPALHRLVAVKVLAELDVESRHRLEKETFALGSVAAHPHILAPLSVGRAARRRSGRAVG